MSRLFQVIFPTVTNPQFSKFSRGDNIVSFTSFGFLFFIFFYFFIVRPVSVLRGHPVRRIFYPRFYPLHFFPSSILQKEPVFYLLILNAFFQFLPSIYVLVFMCILAHVCFFVQIEKNRSFSMVKL